MSSNDQIWNMKYEKYNMKMKNLIEKWNMKYEKWSMKYEVWKINYENEICTVKYEIWNTFLDILLPSCSDTGQKRSSGLSVVVQPGQRPRPVDPPGLHLPHCQHPRDHGQDRQAQVPVHDLRLTQELQIIGSGIAIKK